jgi:two-component sensor histidine kinase
MIKQLSEYRGNIRLWLKAYVFVAVAVLVLGILLYTNHVIGRMEAQSAATTRLFSRFIAEVVFEVEDPGKASILQDVIEEINLPIVITDAEGRPFAWHRIPVPEPADEDYERLATVDPANPPEGAIADVIAIYRRFDRTNPPVAIQPMGNDLVVGYVHFGASKLQRELRLVPFILLALFLVFGFVGFQGFRYLKISEQRSIWVGLAKETAHQLGTPLSALLGWTQLLRDQLTENREKDAMVSVAEMEEDLKRLSKVTERFSKIGARPELRRIDLAPVLDRTVQYFHRRLPRLKADSTISRDFEETPRINANEELIEWVFENLIKNGLDAMGDKGGTIEIRTRHDEAHGRVDVFVSDSGKGVPAALKQRIFSPGFTTKKRGWGLGLALTRRIVEEYHGGELRLVESQPGQGSTFLVRFPSARA